MVYTIQNITLSNTTTVYWTMIDNAVKLSMDGPAYDGSENMMIDPAQTNLPGGIITWTGSTKMPLAAGGTQALISKFIMTATDLGGIAIPLVDPTATGLPAGTGGAVLITSNAMVLKVKLEMFVSDNGGGTWVPHLDYYDAAATPPAAESAYSTYGFGFYWENNAPELVNHELINVDEGDTVIISSSELKADDVESESADLRFILDPLEEGLLPANGKLQVDSTDITLPDTIAMSDIYANLVRYIHNGTETVADSIPLLLFDGDGKRYMIGEDSVFYLKINITPVDDDPIVVKNTGATLDEGGEIVITEDMLLTSDAESSADKIKYTLDPDFATVYPNNDLKLNGVPLIDENTFTQADIAAGRLVYTHKGDEDDTDGFLFRVEDEYGHFASVDGIIDFFFEIDITLTNDNPLFTKNLPLVVNEGDTGVISNLIIAAIDEESGPEDITFTINPDFQVANPVYGKLTLNDVDLADGGTFTMDDVNNNRVKYIHNGEESTGDFIPVGISDPHGGIARDGEYTVFHITIVITPVNDPPTLENPIADQETKATEEYVFIVPENTFADVDEGDELTYAAGLDDGSPLPDWLIFDVATRKFSGVPQESDVGSIAIKVSAFDISLTEATDMFMLEIKTKVGITPGDEHFKVSVYPNPFEDQIHLNISEFYNNEITLRIINLLGEEVLSLKEAPGTKRSIDLSEQPAGIYFIRVEDGNEVQSIKLLKQ